MTLTVNGENFTRSVRRIYRMEDGSAYIGWTKFQGKDVKVRKNKHKKNWILAS